jgi:2,3-bisphosphoglycerate-dependent phosphoglycerate mutase
MRLYYIRHGQSENNARWERTGGSDGRTEDPELTPTGKRQVERLADYLRQQTSHAAGGVNHPPDVNAFDITHIYCSLMVRAVATASPVARALNLPLSAWVDLHETGGIFLQDPETGELAGLPGKTRTYFEAHYPDLLLPDAMSSEGWWNRPFEDYAERYPRAERVAQDLMERHGQTDDRVALVSHGGFYNYLLSVILDVPRREGLWFTLNNVGITRIDFDESRVRVRYTNRIDFLPNELIT